MFHGVLPAIRAKIQMKEQTINGSVSRKFESMMPLDVYKRFLIFAKENSVTGLGKWDFSVALRMLLDRSDFYENYLRLESRLENLEKTKKVEQESDEPKTFGRRRL